MREKDLVFRNHKGEEKVITRQEFRNAARYASDHYSHHPDKQHRPESTTSLDRQFHLVRE